MLVLIEAGTERRTRYLRETAVAVALATHDPKGIDKAFAPGRALPKSTEIDPAVKTFLRGGREEED